MLEEFSELLQLPFVKSLITLFVGIVLLLALTSLLKRVIPRYVEASESRYKFRKVINFTAYVVFVVMVIFVYSNQLSGITVFLGVAGAGIAFALQEVIASFAGFIAIHTSSFYKVGDRVMLGGIKGDVIDIGFLRTTLMQIGDWVDSDRYNGKIVRIANSFVFKEPVFNYSGEFPFLWDEIHIPIKTSGDYQYGKSVFLKILEEEQNEYAKSAAKSWKEMTSKWLVEDARVFPMVSMRFDENWITFTLRYVVDYKMRTATKDRLYSRALEAIRNSDGKLQVATAGIEVVNLHR